ncbi:MAG TPA: glycoside hydrolase family 97 N-terminal domain-containing protein, partial [Candidatus Bathyarchaeia archaeon]|nr:glycoside hydrolase family 97 N-terminal domain-containing protein [Candidatus Bathyarchaeia archaeon]
MTIKNGSAVRTSLLALATLLILALMTLACAPAKEGAGGGGTAALAVKSPDGSLELSMGIRGERLSYRVAYRGVPVLNDSPLGLDLLGAEALDHGFEVVGTSKRSNDSSWQNDFGAKKTVPDKFNEFVVELKEKNAPGRRLDVVARAYDEGVAFRYVLPKQDALDKFAIAAEATGFYFA